MEIAPTAKRSSSVAAVSIPPVVLDRECAQRKDVRYGNRTYGETTVLRSGGFHTAGRARPRLWAAVHGQRPNHPPHPPPACLALQRIRGNNGFGIVVGGRFPTGGARAGGAKPQRPGAPRPTNTNPESMLIPG